MHELLGYDMCPTTTHIPKTGVALSSSDINTIAAWICNGAPNN